MSTERPSVSLISLAVKPVAASKVVPSKERSRSWSVKPNLVPSLRVRRQHQASVVAPVSRWDWRDGGRDFMVRAVVSGQSSVVSREWSVVSFGCVRARMEPDVAACSAAPRHPDDLTISRGSDPEGLTPPHTLISTMGTEGMAPWRKPWMLISSLSVSKRTGTSSSKPAVMAWAAAGMWPGWKVTRPVVWSTV